MPTYDYECQKCGERFEVFQSFAEEPLKKHPGTCRGKVVKVLSPAGIVFSGSGFYKTDNRSSAARSAAKAGGSDSTKSDSGAKSDSGSKDSGSKDSGSKDSGNKDSGSSSSSSSSGGSSKPAPAASTSSS